MKRLAFSTLIFATLFGQAAIAAECVTQTPPTCVEGGGYFENTDAEKTCRAELKAYQKSVTQFWDCQREKSNAIDKEARRAIRLFNCRTRGKETCE